jgi:hypothetical protein
MTNDKQGNLHHLHNNKNTISGIERTIMRWEKIYTYIHYDDDDDDDDDDNIASNNVAYLKAIKILLNQNSIE